MYARTLCCYRYNALLNKVSDDDQWPSYGIKRALERVFAGQNGTCICKSCFSHDLPKNGDPPALPRWYKLVKNGVAELIKKAAAECKVCAHMLECDGQTNSMNLPQLRQV